jgi:large subunit ribosomal protein L9
MPKTIELLLTETVEPLGIVGDVVKVKPGYARNFLLPRGFATEPSEDRIRELAEARAKAQEQLTARRRSREEMVAKLESYELTLTRACNDQGLLYGSVSQQDIADALNEEGFDVRPRDVRIAQTIKRVDSYDIPIRPESDLETEIKLWVVADRKLDTDDEREEMEFDAEGNLVEPTPGEKKREELSETEEEPAAEAAEESEPTTQA